MGSVHVVRLWGKIIRVPAMPSEEMKRDVGVLLRSIERDGVDALPVAEFKHQHTIRSAA